MLAASIDQTTTCTVVWVCSSEILIMGDRTKKTTQTVLCINSVAKSGKALATTSNYQWDCNNNYA